MRRVRLPHVVVLAAMLICLAGCGGPSTTSPSAAGASASVVSGPVTIDIKNFMFQQGSITVRAGTQVTWTNQDPQPTDHTATADDGAFDTGSIAPGSSATRTLKTPGTYTYHCNIHQYMTATITVVG